MKKIILAFDGTGNRFGYTNTNVVKLLQAIDYSSDKDSVMTFYEYGIGTFPYQGFLSNAKSWFSNTYNQAVGKGIRQNIRTAYEHLINIYDADDEIYLYGFSRGAFTARALAGLLHDYGLLNRGHSNLVKQVSHMYHRGKLSATNKKGVPDDMRKSFQRLFTKPCKPRVVGVWDTVGSLGTFFKGEKFVNTELNKDVFLGLQAMAIHEVRRKFPVSIWSNEMKEDGVTRADTQNKIKQAWFAGVHADIGGGYTETGLSDISLEWILEESKKAGLPIRADWQQAIWPTFAPDSKSPKHDEFKKIKWRFLGKKIRIIESGSFIHQSALEWMKTSTEELSLPDQYHLISSSVAR